MKKITYVLAGSITGMNGIFNMDTVNNHNCYLWEMTMKMIRLRMMRSLIDRFPEYAFENDNEDEDVNRGNNDKDNNDNDQIENDEETWKSYLQVGPLA